MKCTEKLKCTVQLIAIWLSLQGQVRKELIVWLKCFDREEIVCSENLEEVVIKSLPEAGEVLQKTCLLSQDKEKPVSTESKGRLSLGF